MKGQLLAQRKRHHISYLLRLWQVRSEDGMVWRASLESARTGERMGFASLGELFRFLEKEVCQVAGDQAAPSAGAMGADIDQGCRCTERLKPHSGSEGRE